MKKIGLLTYHDTINYGSLLQTYATYRAIEEITGNSRSVELIDYKCAEIAKRETIYSLSSCRTLSDIIKSILWNSSLKKKKEAFWRFIDQNMKLSKSYTLDTIAEVNRMYDIFLVGSDIVWSLDITGHDYTYYLDFADDDKKKVSFSSSVGTKWIDEDEEQIRKQLNRFDEICVREQMAKEWIQPIVEKEVHVTCDPTMLWTGEDWKKMQEEAYAPKGRYVLIYLRTDDQKNVSDGIEYARKHNIPAYYINYGKPVLGAKTVRPESIERWLALFANADTVFSASYHGLLFGLYFHKNVFYYNRGNKSRMLSFGKEFDIEYREGNGINLQKDIPICYEAVDKIMEKKRAYSWDMLRKLVE